MGPSKGGAWELEKLQITRYRGLEKRGKRGHAKNRAHSGENPIRIPAAQTRKIKRPGVGGRVSDDEKKGLTSEIAGVRKKKGSPRKTEGTQTGKPPHKGGGCL